MEASEAHAVFVQPAGDDDALLEDLLQFLADNDPYSHLPASSTTASNSTVPVTATDHGVRRRSTYQARKDKIQELRDEVAQLESIIERMQSPRKVRAVVSELLEDVVSRQLAQRLRAQAQNLRLRELIQEQHRLLQQIQRVMSEREASVKRALGRQGRRAIDPSALLNEGVQASDGTELESVTNALVPMFLQTDWVLAQPELATSGRHTLLKPVPWTESRAFHWFDSCIVPFDLNATSKAVEANFVSQLGSRLEGIERIGGVQRTHREEWVDIPGFQGIVRMTMALSRFDDDGRVVFVRSSVFTFLDPDGTNEYVIFPGLPVRHWLWTIVERVPCPVPTATPVSKIQRCGLTIPCFVPHTETQAAAVNKFVVDLAMQFHEFAHNDVDNRLMRGTGTSQYRDAAVFQVTV